MSVSLKYFGARKPGPGVAALRTVVNPKLPFGKKPPVDWMTGQYLSVGPKASLRDLRDVDITTIPPVQGDVLVYNATAGRWLAGAAGGFFPWQFLPTADEETGKLTCGIIEYGEVKLGGVRFAPPGFAGCTEIVDWPEDSRLTDIHVDTLVWLEIDFAAATVTYKSGYYADDYPADTDTLEIWPLFEITCTVEDDENDQAIESVWQIEHSYIHIATTATANDHSFKFTKTSDTGGTLTLGAVYLAGTAKTITSWPTNGLLASVTTTTHYWIAIDLSAGTTTWGSGASLPANTATVEYWEILVLTCAASVITGIKECQISDIHIAPGA